MKISPVGWMRHARILTNGEAPKLNLVSKFNDDDNHPPDNKFIRIASFHSKTFIHEGDQPGCMRRERREEGSKETSARARAKESATSRASCGRIFCFCVVGGFGERSAAMAEDLVDIVVLGASGFTGKYVLRELLKFRNPAGREPRKIAIAGRSKKKLAAALTWAAAGGAASTSAGRTTTKDLESSFSDDGAPPVVIYEADITNVASLRAVCKKTKVVVSCVGPYRKYGQPVVEACVEAGVDYLDITGEPEFMERMELLYHEKAKQTGKILFVSSASPSSLSFFFFYCVHYHFIRFLGFRTEPWC